MLVHSFIYYQLNTSIIEDKTFDKWAYELADAIRNYPEIAKQTPFYNDFKDFDGTTGYNLNFGDPDIQNVGLRLLNIHRDLENRLRTEHGPNNL